MLSNLTHLLNITLGMEELEFQLLTLLLLLLLLLSKKEEFQIAISSTAMPLVLPSRSNTLMLRIIDKIKLITKKLLINGEKDGHHHLDQF